MKIGLTLKSESVRHQTAGGGFKTNTTAARTHVLELKPATCQRHPSPGICVTSILELENDPDVGFFVLKIHRIHQSRTISAAGWDLILQIIALCLN